MPGFNRFQRAIAKVYAEGDFADVEPIDAEGRAPDVGDPLFTFLMNETRDDGAEPMTKEEALRRLGVAMRDVEEAGEAISRLADVIPPGLLAAVEAASGPDDATPGADTGRIDSPSPAGGRAEGVIDAEGIGMDVLRAAREERDARPADDPDAGRLLVAANTYDCDCGEGWTDLWGCSVDDECPECGTTCSPASTEWLEVRVD